MGTASMLTRSLDPAPLQTVDSGKVAKGMDYLRKKTDKCFSNFAKEVSRD